MFMQVGQIPRIYLGKTDPILHTPEKTDIENNSRHTADLLLNRSMFVVERSLSKNQKPEWDNEIKEFKNLFHPAGKWSKVRNMPDKEILELAQKILKEGYYVKKADGNKVTLQSKNVKEIVNPETGAHTHEVVSITTKIYIDKEEKGENQIKFLIDDIDGM